MTTQAPINPSILLDAVCGDRSTAIDLLNMFFELTGIEMERLTTAISSNDAAATSAAAHKIAGSAISCGMNTLSSELRDLEQTCKEGFPDDINTRMQRIRQQLAEGRTFFENHLECQLI